MKRIVLTFGLIAGAIISTALLISFAFQDEIGFERLALVGYSSMVLAFLLIFFGVRSYREQVGGGIVGFWRALVVGLMIVGVASACYVATWEVVYYNFAPDFMSKYQAYVLEQARADGESEQAIARRRVDMEKFAVMYRNPAFNAAVTFLEPLPVGLIVALVSAGVLSSRGKRRKDEDPVLAAAS
jgi:amino acid transporter